MPRQTTLALRHIPLSPLPFPLEITTIIIRLLDRPSLAACASVSKQLGSLAENFLYVHVRADPPSLLMKTTDPMTRSGRIRAGSRKAHLLSLVKTIDVWPHEAHDCNPYSDLGRDLELDTACIRLTTHPAASSPTYVDRRLRLALPNILSVHERESTCHLITSLKPKRHAIRDISLTALLYLSLDCLPGMGENMSELVLVCDTCAERRLDYGMRPDPWEHTTVVHVTIVLYTAAPFIPWCPSGTIEEDYELRELVLSLCFSRCAHITLVNLDSIIFSPPRLSSRTGPAELRKRLMRALELYCPVSTPELLDSKMDSIHLVGMREYLERNDWRGIFEEEEVRLWLDAEESVPS